MKVLSVGPRTTHFLRVTRDILTRRRTVLAEVLALDPVPRDQKSTVCLNLTRGQRLSNNGQWISVVYEETV